MNLEKYNNDELLDLICLYIDDIPMLDSIYKELKNRFNIEKDIFQKLLIEFKNTASSSEKKIKKNEFILYLIDNKNSLYETRNQEKNIELFEFFQDQILKQNNSTYKLAFFLTLIEILEINNEKTILLENVSSSSYKINFNLFVLAFIFIYYKIHLKYPEIRQNNTGQMSFKKLLLEMIIQFGNEYIYFEKNHFKDKLFEKTKDIINLKPIYYINKCLKKYDICNLILIESNYVFIDNKIIDVFQKNSKNFKKYIKDLWNAHLIKLNPNLKEDPLKNIIDDVLKHDLKEIFENYLNDITNFDEKTGDLKLLELISMNIENVSILKGILSIIKNRPDKYIYQIRYLLKKYIELIDSKQKSGLKRNLLNNIEKIKLKYRIFKNKNIYELREEVYKNKYEKDVLNSILEELEHRNNKKSDLLKKNIKTYIEMFDENKGKNSEKFNEIFNNESSSFLTADYKEYINDYKDLKSFYRSSENNLKEEFFDVCFKECKEYNRMSGYFTVSNLVNWCEILKRIKDDDVKIKLVVSPKMSKDDLEFLTKSLENNDNKEEIIETISEEFIMKALKEMDNVSLQNIFTYMIISGKLHMKFAFTNSGIYHEKMGVFYFNNEDVVAFNGSANETYSGYLRNFESIDVFKSWEESDKKRVKNKIEQFDALWNDKLDGLIVRNLSQITLKYIYNLYDASVENEEKDFTDNNSNENSKTQKKFKNTFDKWAHQEEAVKVFLKEKRGLLAMATGTGKTRTALKIIERLFKFKKIENVIICMKAPDLLDQWNKNIIDYFKGKYKTFKEYGEYHNFHYSRYICDNKILLVSTHNIDKVLKESNLDRTIFIFDEVHKSAALKTMKSLDPYMDKIEYRLGLSATPERDYDEVGTNFIFEKIGPIIFEFGLKEAIKKEILCPFNYYPIVYQLNEEERMKIRSIYMNMEAQKKKDPNIDLKQFFIDMARVYKNSIEKIPKLIDFIENNKELLNQSIFFVDTENYGEKLYDIIHKNNSSYHTYFSGDPSEILEKYKKNECKCLITCHRVSEGIDIPHVKNLFMVSADKPLLETIQRVGRSLRYNSDEPGKIASIIDFICEKDDGNLIDGDLNRYEFLKDVSKNKGEW